jgi:hypothetical protein
MKVMDFLHTVETSTYASGTANKLQENKVVLFAACFQLYD